MQAVWLWCYHFTYHLREAPHYYYLDSVVLLVSQKHLMGIFTAGSMLWKLGFTTASVVLDYVHFGQAVVLPTGLPALGSEAVHLTTESCMVGSTVHGHGL